MPRIPLFPTEDMTEAQRRVYDTIVSGPRGVIVGPLRAALHNPKMVVMTLNAHEIPLPASATPPLAPRT